MLWAHTHYPQMSPKCDPNESAGFLSGNADEQNMKITLNPA